MAGKIKMEFDLRSHGEVGLQCFVSSKKSHILSMANPKIAFLEIKDWESEYVRNQLTGYDLFISGKTIDKVDLKTLNDTEVLLVFIYSPVGEKVLGQLPNLKFIATRSTGFDHIDLKA